MSQITTLAWFDGKIQPVQDIRVSPLSHALHYGTGVFEGIRAYEQEGGGGGIFRLKEHIDRLIDSASVLGLELSYDRDQLMEACRETLKANDMKEGYLRPLAWLGEGGMGVAGANCPTHVMIATWPWGAYLGDEGMRKGIRVITSSYERIGPNAGAKNAKLTGAYFVGFMAKRNVLALGMDEAILLDRDGYLTEGSGENLFVVKNGKVITTPTSSPILPGITRNTVMTLCHDHNIPLEEARFTRSEIYAADEVFMVGTAAEVTPIREIDGRPVRTAPGEITQTLQKEYLQLVRGGHVRAKEWITPV
jgi:branched-chain amino acid aminotransferase